METKTSVRTLPRNTAMWIIGLIALSIILFVVGVTFERQTEAGTHPATPATESGGGEGPSETGGEQPHTEGFQPEGQTGEQAHPEAILGINPDNPWLIAAVVLGSIILAAAALRIGYPALPVIALAFIAMAIFDIRESIIQLLRSNNNIAVIAGAVALTRVGVAILSFIAWKDHGKVSGSVAKGN